MTIKYKDKNGMVKFYQEEDSPDLLLACPKCGSTKIEFLPDADKVVCLICAWQGLLEEKKKEKK